MLTHHRRASPTICENGINKINNLIKYITMSSTNQQQEIDYLEESNGKLLACEIKWNAKTKAKLPKTFSENYTNSDFIVVTPDTVDDFLL